MAIEAKYIQKAAAAADALRAALIAVEACGADEELTKIIIRLSDDRTRLCNLFRMPSEQASVRNWYEGRVESLWGLSPHVHEFEGVTHCTFNYEPYGPVGRYCNRRESEPVHLVGGTDRG